MTAKKVRQNGAKVTVVPPDGRTTPRQSDAPVVSAVVPEEAPPVDEASPAPDPTWLRQQQVAAMTSVSEAEAIDALTQRLGQAERQRIMDGVVIGRLVNRILQLSPQDPVATEVAEQQAKEA